MVKDAYDMESVLNEYGIYVDKNNKAVCPKCTGYDFYLLESRTSGHDEWCCDEAHQLLAARAGLRK